jgi:hypothetical protein
MRLRPARDRFEIQVKGWKMKRRKQPPEIVDTLSSRQPLVPLGVAAFLLGMEPRQVMHNVENGGLEYAWDIGGASERHRSEMRIYWRCLFVMFRDQPLGLSDELIYDEIVPPTWLWVKSSILRRRWSCSHRLITSLIQAQILTAHPNAPSGPKSSPDILRESVIQFMRTRRVYADLRKVA